MVQSPFARLVLFCALTLVLAIPGRAPARDARAIPASDFPNIGYATWSDVEPDYRLFPGDAVDIAIPSAPELDRSVVVQPDGRITLPLIAPVMAADRSVEQLERALSAAYAQELLDPEVRVTIKAAAPLKIFVGGEVSKPGLYDMEGDMDALRAIIGAGGFTNGAKRTQVVIIRRGPGGRAMMRIIDLKRALHGAGDGDLAPLRRFDIVYVPKSSIAEAGQFVQQYLRDLIPGQVGFNYTLGGQTLATGVP